MATAVSARVFKNFINGEWVAPTERQNSPESQSRQDRRKSIGEFPLSSQSDVDAAVSAAREAYKTWRLVPAPKRAEILFRAAEILVQRKEEFSRDMTREMGKVLAETRGDVQEAIDMTYYMAGEGRRLFGQTTPSELPNKFAMSVRQSIGVCGMITPWNFPMAIPSWKMMPALICGNTVVLKPAEDTPLSSYHLVASPGRSRNSSRRREHGQRRRPRRGRALGQPRRRSRRQLHGFDATGRIIAQACAPDFQALQPRNGRQKHHHGDGRRQSRSRRGWRGLGRLRHHRPALHRRQPRRRSQKHLQRIRRAFRGARQNIESRQRPRSRRGHGPRHQRATTADRDELRRNRQERRRQAAHRRRSSRSAAIYAKGWFHAPTVFGDCDPQMRIAQEEIFGPVVSVIPIDSLEQGIEVANGVPYGLSASIYTRNVNALSPPSRDLYTGIVYVNAPTIGAETHLPFGGTKQTGNGHREAAIAAIDFFSEWKSIYIDYSDKLQRAQIDNN